MKNFRRIAEIMQPGQPSPYKPGSALDKIWLEIGASAVRNQARYLADSEAARRAVIRACRQRPEGVLRMPFFRRLYPAPLSVSECADIAMTALRRHRIRAVCDHNGLIETWEAAVAARYFRRFGQRIWTRHEVAA